MVLALYRPHLGLPIRVQVRRRVDGNVVQHAAQGAHLVVHECLLLGNDSEFVAASGDQRAEARAARELLTLNTEAARLQLGTLGVAHYRQSLGKGSHGKLTDLRLTVVPSVDPKLGRLQEPKTARASKISSSHEQRRKK